MTNIERSFIAWEEHIVCADRGNRVVHYYLKNASGESVLAVVGTERSLRHMTYVIDDQFVQDYRHCVSFNGGLKWRARRDAVEWLASLVSDHARALEISDMETHESVYASGSLEVTLPGPYLLVQRKLKTNNQNLEWHGNATVCAKELKHYHAFSATETIVSVHSFVFIMAEAGRNYLAYIEDMYEDKRGHKKLKVRWFLYGEDVKGVIPELNPAPREVLITSHVQVISAECFDCPSIVLTPSHYEQCLKVVPDPSILGIYVCFRQFNNNKIKSFCLSKLRGYVNQAILPCLDDPDVDRERAKSSKLNIADEGKTTVDTSGVGIKRKRTSKGYEGPEMGIAKNSAVNGGLVTGERSNSKLKLKLSRKPLGIQFKIPQPPSSTVFRVGDNIEVLCQDSGIRGCWFTCRIVQVSHKNLRVRYKDLEEAEGPGNLEEWISALRVAAPDRLGIRVCGRPVVRPCPPNDSTDCLFCIGDPVDAWFCDGWWEGFVIGHDESGTDTLQVYLPGENNFLVLDRNSIRISRDWINNRWIAIKPKHDIVHYISSNVIPGTMLSGSFKLIRVPGRGGLALPQQDSHAVLSHESIEEVQNEGPLEVGKDIENTRSSENEGGVNQPEEAAPLNDDNSVLMADLVDSANQKCETMEAVMIRALGCSVTGLQQLELQTASRLEAIEEAELEGPLEDARARRNRSPCDRVGVNQSSEEAALILDNSVLAAELVNSADQKCKGKETSLIGVPGHNGLALSHLEFQTASRLKAMEESENEVTLEVARATGIERSCDCDGGVNQSGEEATLSLQNSVLAADLVNSPNQKGKATEAAMTRVPGHSNLALSQHEFQTASTLEGVNQSGEEATLCLQNSVLAADLVNSANKKGKATEAVMVRVPGHSGLALSQHEFQTASTLEATEESENEVPVGVARTTGSTRSYDCNGGGNQPVEKQLSA